AVISLSWLESEPLTRFDCIETLVLELVRANFVRQPDAAPLLIQVKEHTSSFSRDPPHRKIELSTAIAADRVKDIAGEALGVDPNKDVFAIRDVAAHERDVGLIIQHVLERVDIEVAVV